MSTFHRPLAGSRLARALLASAVLVALGPAARANPVDELATGSVGGARLLAAPPLLERSDYAAGDKVKISFFAQLDIPGGGQASAAVKTFYQRLDLTGEYTVDADGTVDIPRLGRIKFAGRGKDEVRGALVDAYEQEIGQTGDVHVAVLERLPIYVVGPVRSPGQYKYVAGMVAIQAIALAGGSARPNDVIGTVLETGRESGRTAEARTRLAGLLARQARLAAEDSGRPMDRPEELARLVGPDEVQRLLDMERRASLQSETARLQEMRGYDDWIRGAADEIASLKQAKAHAADEIELRRRRLKQVVQPDPRLTDQTLVRALQGEIADLETQRDTLDRQVHQLAQQSQQAVNVRKKIALEHAADVSNQLVQIADEIARTREAVRSGDDLSSSLRQQGAPGAPSLLDIAIVRSTPGGPVAFPASPTSELAPGDVVQVEARQKQSSLGSLSAEDLRP